MTDVFITLLTLGREGYQHLLQQRKDAYVYLQEKLAAVAAAHGERVLSTRGNPISLAMTLSTVARDLTLAGKDVTFFGSMLFTRCVSGTRYRCCTFFVRALLRPTIVNFC
jgi:O-phospho-L-seryl-tRNASec:L-selenocysteinyl-tRNA synthase